MRNRVSSNSLRARLSLTLLGTLLAALAFAGCGGGGGGGGGNNGGGNNGGGGTGATRVTGQILDTAQAPVAGAVVTIVNTSRSATTDANGTYNITNVPLGQARVRVKNPANYYAYAQYNSGVYDLTTCSFPVGNVVQGDNSGPTLYLYSSSSSSPPPPPPTGGCP